MNKVIIVSLMFLFAACAGTGEKSEKRGTGTDLHAASAEKYACPMQCEGDKTYSEAGKCPVCKMDLQEVAMVETDSTVHEH